MTHITNLPMPSTLVWSLGSEITPEYLPFITQRNQPPLELLAGVAATNMSLWIEFWPRAHDAEWDLDCRWAVEDEFRRLLLPLGLTEQGSGGFFIAGLDLRDIDFALPQGTDLDAIRQQVEQYDFGCDWTFQLDSEIDDEG